MRGEPRNYVENLRIMNRQKRDLEGWSHGIQKGLQDDKAEKYQSHHKT